MAGKSSYTDADRSKVFVALAVNDGVVERAAKDSGIPAQTVRDWKRKWEAEGVPDSVLQAAEDVVDTFVDDAVRIRSQAIRRMEELIPQTKDLKALNAVVGTLDDKIIRARGLPTSRQEHTVIALPAPEELLKALGEQAARAVDAARTREADIIEVEAEIVREQPRRTLPAAS